jgi:hypothetical protein
MGRIPEQVPGDQVIREKTEQDIGQLQINWWAIEDSNL